MATRVHVALALRIKLNLERTFVGIYRFMIWYLSWDAFRKYKIVSSKKKEFDDLQDLLVSY
jgi:hypothetical protein